MYKTYSLHQQKLEETAVIIQFLIICFYYSNVLESDSTKSDKIRQNFCALDTTLQQKKCSFHICSIILINIPKGKVKFVLCTTGIGLGTHACIHSNQIVIFSLQNISTVNVYKVQ